MGRRRTERILVGKRTGGVLARAPDELIVEEPLEIRLDGALVTTTMRTLGHDFELAAGLCLTDGLLAGVGVRGITYCSDRSALEGEFNVVDVDTGATAPPPPGRLAAADLGLFVSGRASFEMVAKAWAGGFPAVVAVSAPTALAVATARTAGLALAGFVRGDRMTVYAPAP